MREVIGGSRREGKVQVPVQDSALCRVPQDCHETQPSHDHCVECFCAMNVASALL